MPAFRSGSAPGGCSHHCAKGANHNCSRRTEQQQSGACARVLATRAAEYPAARIRGGAGQHGFNIGAIHEHVIEVECPRNAERDPRNFEICQVLPPIQRLLGCMQNRIMMEVRVNVYIRVIAHVIRQFSVYDDRNVRVAVQMLQYSC